MVTIYDVARDAGVSPATVSRVLNGNQEVSKDLAERVRASVSALGYRRNSLARSLRRQSTTVWGLIISDIENPFFTSVARGIEDVAHQSGFSVVLCNSDEDLEKEARYLELVVEERMAGAIIAPASESDTDIGPLVQRKMPVVALDRQLSRFAVDTALVDNAQGAEQATTHLLDVGAKRPACVTGPERTTTGSERLEGFQRALAQAGRASDPDYVRRSNFREDGGYTSTCQLLELHEPPDALFVANNLMALGALRALREYGAMVPRDVTFVCFDELPWAGLIHPSVTTVSQPTHALGRAAAELLLSRTREYAGPPKEIMLPPTLKVRESSQASLVP
jgi:LacI family transcriptional regulator